MTRKAAFFEGWFWLKFNNLRLALGTNLNFYTSVAKGLKLKVLGANSYVYRSFEGNTGRGPFWPSPPSWIGLRMPVSLNQYRSTVEILNNYFCLYIKVWKSIFSEAFSGFLSYGLYSSLQWQKTYIPYTLSNVIDIKIKCVQWC